MKWYFSFNEAATNWFADMIKVAVISARAKTDLEPHCICDGRPSPFTDWLQRWNVKMHFQPVFFRQRLKAQDVLARNGNNGYDPEAASGFYLPLQIAEIEQNDEFVLFTDCDVMFFKPVDFREVRPLYLAAVPEVADLANLSPCPAASGFNSGVMIINVAGLRSRRADLLECLEKHNFFRFPEAFATYDQGVFNTVFKSEWLPLPPHLNWRVFFGANPDAAIVHWHGPKPIHVGDLVSGRPPNRTYTPPGVDDLVTRALPAYLRYYENFQSLLRLAGS